MNRHNSDERLDKVLETIKTEPETVKIKDLAEEMGVSYRTLSSDVRFLRKKYPEIKATKGRYGGGLYFDK